MDDDDFEYDDNYDYSEDDEYQEEEMRAELELDDLRSALKQNSDFALSRLRKLALNHHTKFCIDASMELMQSDPSLEHFRILINAITGHPPDVSDLTKANFLEQGWNILERNSALSQADLLQAYVHAVNVLKNSKHRGLYLRSVLLLASVHIRMGMSDDADILLNVEFRNAHTPDVSEAWVASLQAEALVLELERHMLQDHLHLILFNEFLDKLQTAPLGNLLPVRVFLVEEAKARYYVETHQFNEARSLLKRTVRGYEEILNTHKSADQFLRAIVWLILVSTLCEGGSYNFDIDLPTLNSFRTNDTVKSAIEISVAFRDLSPHKLDMAMSDIKCWMNRSVWRLGAEVLMKELNETFNEMYVHHILSTYSRIRWTTLQKRLDHPNRFQVTHETLTQLMLKNHQRTKSGADFRLNLTDHTIESVPITHGCQFPPKKKIPTQLLPQMYRDRETHGVQSQKEFAIMNKWQANAFKSTSGSAVPSISAELQNNEEALSALQRALQRHKESMLN